MNIPKKPRPSRTERSYREEIEEANKALDEVSGLSGRGHVLALRIAALVSDGRTRHYHVAGERDEARRLVAERDRALLAICDALSVSAAGDIIGKIEAMKATHAACVRESDSAQAWERLARRLADACGVELYQRGDDTWWWSRQPVTDDRDAVIAALLSLIASRAEGMDPEAVLRIARRSAAAAMRK